MKLRHFIQRLGEPRISKSGGKWQPASLLSRCAFSAYPYLFILGLLSAYVFCSAVSGIIASRMIKEQLALAEIISRRDPSPFISQEAAKNLNSEIKFAAFGVADANPASEKKETVEAKPIDSFRLVGTLPRIGAWINVDNATPLVLREQEFNGYILEQIDRGSVIFTREGESFPLFLNLSGANAATPPPAQPQNPQPPAQAGPPSNASISGAEFNGNEGTITRELLNDLIANPMQILSTVRLVPDGAGMRIARVRSDNLLAQLGIKQGDLLTGINGIAINSGTDIMNVMKSLLQGNRFDLQMSRGQENGMLRYSVR
jgi:type II secretory pathway component PulC